MWAKFQNNRQSYLHPLESSTFQGSVFWTLALSYLSCNTISQLLLHNAKKQTRVAKTSYRHSYQREPPVPLYVGLSLHTQTRSKKLVDSFEKLGLSISYDRVLQLENLLAENVCEQFKLEGIVCADNLRKGIYTIGALDNIDHNPSSTSAQGSLHGTAISIIQNPTKENPGIE